MTATVIARFADPVTWFAEHADRVHGGPGVVAAHDGLAPHAHHGTEIEWSDQ